MRSSTEPTIAEQALKEFEEETFRQAVEQRKRQLRENREGVLYDAIPQQQFHAQILSIAG